MKVKYSVYGNIVDDSVRLSGRYAAGNPESENTDMSEFHHQKSVFTSIYTSSSKTDEVVFCTVQRDM